MRAAIEQGQQLSPEFLERLGETPRGSDADLRRGAVALGGLVAVGPLTQSVVHLGTWLAGSAANWREFGAVEALPLSMAVLLVTAAWLVPFRWLTR